MDRRDETNSPRKDQVSEEILEVCRLIEAFRVRLGSDWVEDHMSLATQDTEMALENLCTQIHEFDLKISADELREIRRHCGKWQVDDQFYSDLNNTK